MDSDGQPDAQAGSAGGGSGNGDDGNAGTATGTCTNNDDEDGVKLVTPLIPGSTACVAINAVNSGSTATLYGWMDFNGDGDFDGDANESLTFTSGGTVANGGATNQQACFTVPANATFTGGDTHMRFRLTNRHTQRRHTLGWRRDKLAKWKIITANWRVWVTICGWTAAQRLTLRTLGTRP